MTTSIEFLCGLPEEDAPVHDCFRVPPLRHSPARDTAYAVIAVQAHRTVARVTKELAREFYWNPGELDRIFGSPGLWLSPSVDLVSFLRFAGRGPRRHVGLGGEVPSINLRAAMLYARWMRARAKKRQVITSIPGTIGVLRIVFNEETLDMSIVNCPRGTSTMNIDQALLLFAYMSEPQRHGVLRRLASTTSTVSQLTSDCPCESCVESREAFRSAVAMVINNIESEILTTQETKGLV